MDDKNTNVTKSHKVLLANRKSGAFRRGGRVVI